MSNWEPEEVSDADMEGIAGGAGKTSAEDKKKAQKKENDGTDTGFPGGGKEEKRPPYKK
ncbi:MAG: hypothetical protein VX949_06170 [Planctomycetota bacterium]|nr:hypothetical protein [Planctomycetota bacterium]